MQTPSPQVLDPLIGNSDSKTEPKGGHVTAVSGRGVVACPGAGQPVLIDSSCRQRSSRARPGSSLKALLPAPPGLVPGAEPLRSASESADGC